MPGFGWCIRAAEGFLRCPLLGPKRSLGHTLKTPVRWRPTVGAVRRDQLVARSLEEGAVWLPSRRYRAQCIHQPSEAGVPHRDFVAPRCSHRSWTARPATSLLSRRTRHRMSRRKGAAARQSDRFRPGSSELRKPDIDSRRSTSQLGSRGGKRTDEIPSGAPTTKRRVDRAGSDNACNQLAHASHDIGDTRGQILGTLSRHDATRRS